ncbi:MAG: putative sulfate exporter family transporter [Gammaproteobacteria bacterium]|nr:putative sulfate exporter family transporter [Gammaproteobacteria bacterium]
MQRLRSLLVPDWVRYLPGLAFCLAFAFAGMNLDRFVSNYHKADEASLAIPALQLKLQEMVKSGDSGGSLLTVRTAIEKHRSALDKVGGTVGQKWGWATFLSEKAQLKYVAILLLGGILIRNTLPLPKSLYPGISIARAIIKPGIIILGVHYVWADIVKVGGVGLALVVVFIFGTAIVVMWLCKKWGVSDGLGGIMGAGTGVCGVSAIIATSPVVRSSPIEMAYAIGTILFFGTLMLFTLPYIGTSIDLSESQFGAWSAVAILNTAQLVAAAEWYGTEARDTAVLINVARIMLLPLVVLFSLWFYILRTGKLEPGQEINKWQLVKDKFPVFILGFFLLVFLNSLKLDALGGPKIAGSAFWALNSVYIWFFAVGFAGIGLSISIDDMKKAGGKAFTIGMVAALVKMVLGLGAVLLIGSRWLQVTGT